MVIFFLKKYVSEENHTTRKNFFTEREKEREKKKEKRSKLIVVANKICKYILVTSAV